MHEPLLNIAIQAALAAGNIIIRAMDRLDKVKISEKSPNDFVTEIDQASEREIISIIKKAYPKHSILAEESGEVEGNEITWIIDPLDGTRNFIHGVPHFAVSIAISNKDRIEHGVIYDPVRQELFTASRGKGAQLNNRRIRVSTHDKLQSALLGTGFCHSQLQKHTDAYIEALRALVPTCSDLRRAGAATLDLAYVACGRFDGFWELNLRPWDLAAGALLVKEAGGLVCDIDGGDNYLNTGNIIAGNPKILKLLLKQLRPFFTSL